MSASDHQGVVHSKHCRLICCLNWSNLFIFIFFVRRSLCTNEIRNHSKLTHFELTGAE